MTTRHVERVVIDECLGKAPPILVALRSLLGNRPLELVVIAAEHVGIPDAEILDKLMDARTALLTRDRVLHNLAIARGFRSFMVTAQNTLTETRVPRVSAPARRLPVSSVSINNYVHQPSPAAQSIISRLVNVFSEHQLKGFRTKRRRIRAHFGSAANIGALALTIAHRRTSSGVVGGYTLNLAARQGVNGLSPASEGYFLDCDQTDEPLRATCWALFHILLLQLERHPITLYHVDRGVLSGCSALLADPACALTPVEHLAARLFAVMSRPKVLPCVKGRFFERATQKLNHLVRLDTNELIEVDFRAIARALIRSDERQSGHAHKSGPPPDWTWEHDGLPVYEGDDSHQVPF